ncbi:hypothetical protein F7725_008932 [Dissostichus mawsoni]|uniref:Uncharacterized protein n=1 Tax=Dissostichus mawsoni TaxID=36200 RepID=A0A7J5Z6A5_DISMA|nr:hypothetical protein F7725_008932 [Dissostichus mawsoni]
MDRPHRLNLLPKTLWGRMNRFCSLSKSSGIDIIGSSSGRDIMGSVPCLKSSGRDILGSVPCLKPSGIDIIGSQTGVQVHDESPGGFGTLSEVRNWFTHVEKFGSLSKAIRKLVGRTGFKMALVTALRRLVRSDNKVTVHFFNRDGEKITEETYKSLGPVTDEEMDMLDLAYGLSDTFKSLLAFNDNRRE